MTAGAMTESHESPWRQPPPGLAQLGRYRVLAEIGRGGIGTVYVACADGPTGFRKLVAIKTLRPELAADPGLIRMLLEEAQVASRLQHPHIVQLYDLGDDGGPFLVMEYVHGESLSAVGGAVGGAAPPVRGGGSPLTPRGRGASAAPRAGGGAPAGPGPAQACARPTTFVEH